MALINDLLDLSSIESAEATGAVLRKEKVPVRELTQRAISQVQGRATEKRQRILAEFGTEAVIGDPIRVEQVLVNLLSNASKYVQPGGQIEVVWEELKEGTMLYVRDNGPGIPPDSQSRLFERFYRVDRARSREEGGTGLGLAIVKHIMQRHGGAAWVTSEPGKGSEFACRFPGER
jgi:two-component system phosphate regulon sensor histidine kinase PhoR